MLEGVPLFTLRLAPDYETVVREDGQGEATVLVHGTPLDARSWDALVPALARDSRVIRYDLRAHGSAGGCPPAGSYHALVDDLLALLDALELDRVHVVGHSLGGQLVQALAVDAPARVSTLTVVCARATPFPAFAQAAARIRRDGLAASIPATLARWFGPTTLAREPRAVRYARQCIRSIEPAAYASALELIAHFDLLERLAAVEAPTRLIGAQRDPVSTPAELRRSHSLVAGSELEIVAAAGHMLPLEHPRLLARAILGSSARGTR